MPARQTFVIECETCGYRREAIGTEAEARASALRLGWEARPVDGGGEGYLCPHCKLLDGAEECWLP